MHRALPTSAYQMADFFPAIHRGKSRTEGSHTYILTDPNMRYNSGDVINDFMSTFISFYFLSLFDNLLGTGNTGRNKT